MAVLTIFNRSIIQKALISSNICLNKIIRNLYEITVKQSTAKFNMQIGY